MNLAPTSDNKPIRDIAYESLKHAIITGEIPAGSRIVETEYADRMHISRTPLREALRKLERDGLVEYILRRGVVVRAFTIEDVEEIYTIRNALEMLTLPAIIEKATPENIKELRDILSEMDEFSRIGDIDSLSPRARAFHAKLTSISGLNRILRVIEGQDEYITRFSAVAIAKEDRRQAAHQEHYRLVNYVEQKNLEKFERLMGKHIERSKETCLIALHESKLKKEAEKEKENGK
ncbi:MAG: GntR family transcriptional regulator [Clostridiales bacterium]|nr:GntR family transcriptional regulator [Clostridiales bacterium]